MPFILSKCANDGIYVINRNKKILVRGKHGVKPLTPFSNIEPKKTPNGVSTFVSDEDLNTLLQHKSFGRHVEKGHISFVSSAEEIKPKVKEMVADNSVQLNSKSLKNLK